MVDPRRLLTPSDEKLTQRANMQEGGGGKYVLKSQLKVMMLRGVQTRSQEVDDAAAGIEDDRSAPSSRTTAGSES